MYFAFKDQLEDFIVEELLEQQPSGHGDCLYLWIEKKGINTMDILQHLKEKLGIPREDLGISGLKDKDGITRQRLSIYKKRLQQFGGIEKFLEVLGEKVSILRKERHDVPLAVGKNKGNRFVIRLRKRAPLPETLKLQLEAQLEKSKKNGFPNAFGIQRFGKGNKNYKKCLKIFEAASTTPLSYEVKFKLQAFGSMWFNAYVMHRREEELWLLDGDIMVNGMNAFGTQVASYQVGKLHHFDYRQCKEQYARQAFFEPDFETFRSDWQEEKWRVSGPVLGWNQLLAPAHSPARELDDALIEISKFMPRGSEISQYYNLYGFRRALRIYPQQLEWEWDNGDLLLRFELPTGAYASVFLASVLQEIDPLGCISNSLIIPLPK